MQMIFALFSIVCWVVRSTSAAEIHLDVIPQGDGDYSGALDDGTCLLQTSILRQRQGISKDPSDASVSGHSNASASMIQVDSNATAGHSKVYSNATSDVATTSSDLSNSTRRRKSDAATQSVVSQNFTVFRTVAGYLTVLFFISLFAYILWKVRCLHVEYREFQDHNPLTENGDFNTFLRYRFAYWFAWTEGSKTIVLLVITFSVIIMGAVIYSLVVNHSFAAAVYKGFIWMIDPSGGVDEQSYSGATIGACMSMAGLLVFALVLTLLQDGFNDYLATLRQGKDPVMENGHTVLIGITDETMGVIQQLCMAHESTGGTVIVILSEDLDKPEMEEKIAKTGLDMLGSRVMVRHGQPHKIEDLHHVAADTAGTIVLMADRSQAKEVRDAFILRALVSIRSEGWPVQGRILAVLSLMRNRPLFEQVGGPTTDIVLLDRFLAKLMVQCTRQWGLGSIVGQTFGFEGSEFYIRPVPQHLVGCSFSVASFYYPGAVLCGIIHDVEGGKGPVKRTVEMCPRMTRELQAGEEFVLLAEDSASAWPSNKPSKRPPSLMTEVDAHEPLSHREHLPEHIMILGWNEMLGVMLLELDLMVAKGTEVLILAPKPADERDSLIDKVQHRWDTKLKNITKFHHIVGQLGSRFQLDELPTPIEDASRIFILADEDAPDPQYCDACTVATILQIRDILLNKGLGRDIPIIPEIRDALTENICVSVKASDFIDSSGLPAQVLAMMAYQPRIADVLEEIISENGSVSFAIRKLDKYCLPVPEKISFFQARDIVAQAGDALVGWSVPAALRHDEELLHADGAQGCFHRKMDEILHKVHPESTSLEWIINPQSKNDVREWSAEDDRVVVLTPYTH